MRFVYKKTMWILCKFSGLPLFRSLFLNKMDFRCGQIVQAPSALYYWYRRPEKSKTCLYFCLVNFFLNVFRLVFNWRSSWWVNKTWLCLGFPTVIGLEKWWSKLEKRWEHFLSGQTTISRFDVFSAGLLPSFQPVLFHYLHYYQPVPIVLQIKSTITFLDRTGPLFLRRNICYVIR